jgi:hypothetical protein
VSAHHSYEAVFVEVLEEISQAVAYGMIVKCPSECFFDVCSVFAFFQIVSIDASVETFFVTVGHKRVVAFVEFFGGIEMIGEVECFAHVGQIEASF